MRHRAAARVASCVASGIAVRAVAVIGLGRDLVLCVLAFSDLVGSLNAYLKGVETHKLKLRGVIQ